MQTSNRLPGYAEGKISRMVLACVLGIPVRYDRANVVVVLPVEYVPDMANFMTIVLIEPSGRKMSVYLIQVKLGLVNSFFHRHPAFKSVLFNYFIYSRFQIIKLM